MKPEVTDSERLSHLLDVLVSECGDAIPERYRPMLKKEIYEQIGLEIIALRKTSGG